MKNRDSYRDELARDVLLTMMQGVYATATADVLARYAVEQADALIAELAKDRK